MRYLIVIPARGGSKGIPKKNIYPIMGKPLLRYSIDMMKEVSFSGDLVVSTDSEEIGEVALMGLETVYRDDVLTVGVPLGCEAENLQEAVPGQVTVIKRPEDISGDTASTEVALLHALEVMEAYTGKAYDAVITLQATSPLRKAQTVQKCLEQYEKMRDTYDALLTLSETRADYWVMEEEGHYHRLYPNAPRRRQERKPMYVENSALYITDAKALAETRLVLGHRVNGYVIPEIEGVDINEPIDIRIAEELLKQV